MNRKIRGATLLAVATSVMAFGAAHAQPSSSAPALSAEALARCAAQVQTLREESTRINQKNAEYDIRRKAINERTVMLKAERDSPQAKELEPGLAFRKSLEEHHAATLAFNAEIEQIKRDIVAVTALKQDYDTSCANRSYRRADLDAMPEAARTAMRAGLGDVQVPYLDSASSR